MNSFNNHLRQIILLGVIILIGILIIKNFFIFLPGVLGAITLYILSRKSYFHLIEKKKWKKGWTALLYIFGFTILICLPVYLAVVMLLPKLIALFNNPVPLIVTVKSFSQKIQNTVGIEIISGDNLQAATKNLAVKLPSLLTGTANFITNLLLMLLSIETDIMIRANAIGIPLLAIIQGLAGALGYFIFQVNQFGAWGFLTGVASLIPIIGTGIIWVPLTIYFLASGYTWQGLGLGLYSLTVLTNVDYVARITLLRKIGNVHPLITIFGVIIGISIFGFIGLIFGPLLISYFIVLIKIYRNEFNAVPIEPIHSEEKK